MTFYEFIASMTDSEIESYAERCGTTVNYLKIHLKLGKKVPRHELMNSLWEHSNGMLTRQVVLDHFFPKTETAA